MTVNLHGITYDAVVIEQLQTSVMQPGATSADVVVLDQRVVEVVEVERPSQVIVLTAPGEPQVLFVDSPGGPKGDPGAPGPSGPPGPAGQPRWEGTGPPGVIVGASPGDLYLDRTTGDLYRLD
jgi:hypothetical protein